MPKTKISEYSATANSNTDVASINIDEGCAPSGINNAIRAVMGHLKDFQTGTASDPLTVGGALTTSSTVTHSAGTANGVAYLNGSKVLTTGSALVFDGTNLGIGASSPTNSANYKTLDIRGTNGGQFVLGRTATSSDLFMYSTSTGSTIGANASMFLRFMTNSDGTTNERMRIDSSGNLGLGVTPSTKLDIGSGTFRIKNATGDTSGLLIYQDTGDSSTFKNYYTGPFKWIQGSTQAMTLDASGNLLVGTTTAYNSITVKANSGANALAIVGRSSDDIGFLNFHRTNGTLLAAIGANPTALEFDVSGSERMRIDSSGNLLVGTTSTSPTSGSAFIAGSATYQIMAHASGSSSGAAYHRFDYNSGAIGSITQTGTTAVLYNTTSDQRLKENIEDAESASALIDSLQVRQFDWKTDNSHQRYGFVAQELVTVAPEAVHQPVNEEEMMAVDYSKLVPMLVKEIQSLRQRIASLEA